MKKVSRCLGILILAGGMAAPATYAAQQPNGIPAAPMDHHLAGHDHHMGQGFHKCNALSQAGESATGYSSHVVSTAGIGQGYLGPGRTDPLPPDTAGLRKDAAGQVCCLIDLAPDRPTS